jgi:hypothetical protein
VSGQALLPGPIAKYKVAAGVNAETSVDGYTASVSDIPAGVIDEFLPPAGVPNNDLFYLGIDGPTQVETAKTGAVSIAQGNRLVPGTGTSNTSDDAGRVAVQDLTGTGAAFANNIENRIGIADAAATTNNALINAVVHVHR